jgi:hypothetical protein
VEREGIDIMALSVYKFHSSAIAGMVSVHEEGLDGWMGLEGFGRPPVMMDFLWLDFNLPC